MMRRTCSSTVDRLTVPAAMAFLSAGPKNFADGSSNSMPLLAQLTVLWQELKSLTTNPSKPHCPRRMSVSSSRFSHENALLTWFFAHMTDPLCPWRTDASNAGR